MDTMTEKKMPRIPGFFAAFIMLVTWAGAIILIVLHSPSENALPDAWFVSGLLYLILSSLAYNGFFIVQPNQAKAFIFFGRYAGTCAEPGFWFTNPLCTRRKLSLRMRNFSSQTIKVNDAGGNPIEIAAVVVWQVTDTAKALFAVDNYENYVVIQSETGVRNLASHYPYDTADAALDSLRGSPDRISEALRHQLQDRLGLAGVTVVEARLSHLAYAPEIAQTMLRRQQAAAIIAARRLIVDGAVGMVQMALASLEENGIVKLDEERKAAMVNNLLVALVSESEAQPVINTGSLYT